MSTATTYKSAHCNSAQLTMTRQRWMQGQNITNIVLQRVSRAEHLIVVLELLHLLPPAEPELWKAMQKQHQRLALSSPCRHCVYPAQHQCPHFFLSMFLFGDHLEGWEFDKAAARHLTPFTSTNPCSRSNGSLNFIAERSFVAKKVLCLRPEVFWFLG